MTVPLDRLLLTFADKLVESIEVGLPRHLIQGSVVDVAGGKAVGVVDRAVDRGRPILVALADSLDFGFKKRVTCQLSVLLLPGRRRGVPLVT